MTILTLLSVMLFGMALPALASLHHHNECPMKCCADVQHDQAMQANQSHQHSQNHKTHNCPMANECSADAVPAPLVIQSELPSQKPQCRVNFSLSTLILNFALPASSHYHQGFYQNTFYRTSRDILTSQSLLLI